VATNRQRFDASINYYEVLNVPYSANRDEITRAYRTLMRAVHPDRHAGAQARAKAEERAKLINAAYAVLSKSDVRREYDQAIKTQAVSDAIFQRYTGNVPGHHTHMNSYRPQRRPRSPEMERHQRRAQRSAFLQIMLFAVIFGIVVILLIVGVSLAVQGVSAIF
jgi:curved DNA-binding protein CbpA